MYFDFKLLAQTLSTGFVVGAIFTWLKLPIPAPSEFAAIVGIFGVFLGMVVVKMFL